MVSIVKKKSSRPRWITVCIFCDIAVAVTAVLSYLVLYLAHGFDGADFMGVLAALLFVSVAIIILLLIVELCTIQKTMRQVRPSACCVSIEVLLTRNVSLNITSHACVVGDEPLVIDSEASVYREIGGAQPCYLLLHVPSDGG